MYEVANQLMLASDDAGLARYDWNSGFWLSTWNSGNWLTSNNVQGISVSGNLLAILNGAAVQTYDINSAVFLQTYQLTDWGLFNDGQEILLWPSIGFRSPASEIMLVSDGGGNLAKLDWAASQPFVGSMLLSSGPTSGQMSDATELDGVVYIASTGFVERFDTLNSMVTPTFIGDNVNHLTNDGTDIYIAGESSGAHKMSTNGTIIQTWDTSQGLASNSVQRLAVSGNS